MTTPIHVILRACDRVTGVHSSERPYGLSKADCLAVTIRSLVAALEDTPHSIDVIEDGLSPRSEARLRSVASEWISIGGKGPRPSLRTAFEQACTHQPDHWIYLLEDDYAHAPDAFTHILDLIENREAYLGPHAGRDLFIHLPDYIDRYRPQEWAPGGLNDQYHLFLGQGIHWRQVYNTTHTFLAQAGSLQKHTDVWAETDTNDAVWSREVYRRPDTLCLSPIPGLAKHLEVYAPATPGRDWEALTRAYLKRPQLPRRMRG